MNHRSDIQTLNVIGAISQDDKALDDFKGNGLFETLAGKSNKKPIVYDLMPIDMVSEHEGTKTYFPLKAVKSALPTILMTPIHISGDRENHFEEDGTAVAIGSVVAARIKKIKGVNYLRLAGFLFDKDYPTEVDEIERWKKELGASFEIQYTSASEYEKGVVSVDEFEFSGSAILKKTAAAYPTAQVVVASKDGNSVFLDLEYFDKAKALGADIKADKKGVQGMVVSDSYQELNSRISKKLHENDQDWNLSLLATFSDRIVYQDWKENKFYKATYKDEGGEIILGKPVEVKVKFVKAQKSGKDVEGGMLITEEVIEIVKPNGVTIFKGGDRLMSKLLGVGADFCDNCQPVLASKVEGKDLILGEAIQETEVVKTLEGKVSELSSENETLKTENATMKGENEALKIKLQDVETEKARTETEKKINEKFAELKGGYQDSDHDELKNVITRQVVGYKDIEGDADRLAQAGKDGEFMVIKKVGSGDNDTGNLMVGGAADTGGMGQIVDKINPGKKAIL